MGGQACVLYGGAEFSRDTDLAILCDEPNLKRLKGALEEGEALRQKNLHMEVELQQIGAQLDDIHRSTMWRTWAVLRRIKDLVTSPWSKT